MFRAFLVSFAFAVLEIPVSIYLMKNDGLFSGYEPIVITAAAALCGLIYGLVAARLDVRRGLVIIGALIAATFPILVFVGPTIFCIAFLPHASCM